MENPYFAFFPGDYLADTIGLSCCEHGVYLLLLAASWQRGPLPDNMDHLARLTANPPIEALRYILEQYWTRNEIGWINTRLERERIRLRDLKEKRSAAAKKAVEAREAKRDLLSASFGDANDKHTISTHTHTHTHNHKQKKTTDMSGKSPTSPPSDWTVETKILEHLNASAGRKYKVRNGKGVSSNLKIIRQRLKEHSEKELISVIDAKVQAWGRDDKMAPYLRPATLFGQSKCEQYVGELNAAHVKERDYGSF